MQTFGFGEEIVAKRDGRREGKISCRHRKRGGVVYTGIQRELYSFNQVKSDCVFEPTESSQLQHVLEAADTNIN